MTIGERLKEERSRLGMNQTDIGALGGVGKTTQINYEKGNGVPDARYLAAVAEKGVDVLYVITGQRKPLENTQLPATLAGFVELLVGLEPEDLEVLRRTAQAFARPKS